MTPDAFDRLLARREELRTAHEGWCDDCNGVFPLPDTSYEARRRDQAYAELQEVEALIEAELEAERALEAAQ